MKQASTLILLSAAVLIPGAAAPAQPFQSVDSIEVYLIRLLLEDDEEICYFLDSDLNGDGEEDRIVRTYRIDSDGRELWGEGRFLVLGDTRDCPSALASVSLESDLNLEPEHRIQQVRSDGGLGIIEESPCRVGALCANILTWTDEGYNVFTFISSRMELSIGSDGTVLVGQRDQYTDPRCNGLTKVYWWNGEDYCLTEIRFDGPGYEGPEGAIQAFYNAINICVWHDSFQSAYNYLSQDMQSSNPLDEFNAGFASTKSTQVDTMSTTSEDEDHAEVQVNITIIEDVDGVYSPESFSIQWHLVTEDGTWRLDNFHAVEIPTPDPGPAP